MHHDRPFSQFARGASDALRRFALILTALLLFLIYAAVYPHHMELAGDQTAQVVAAESLLRDGTYKVPLHESYGPGTIVDIGADLRQPLRWYPPGYSIALYGLARLGLSLAGASLLLFYLAKFVFTLTWLAAGRAYNIPCGILSFSVAFSLLLTYPSTTTEIFESISVALFFLALSRRLSIPASAALASASIAAGALFRFSSVRLLGFYGLVEWIRRPRLATVLKVAAVSIAPIAEYLVFTRVIGGEPSPYHGVGPGPHTSWRLLLKGLYYAVTGGWSPVSLPLKALLLGLLVLAGVGLYRLLRNGSLPEWITLLIAFEAYCIFFLIITQLLYGSMYADVQPAFATPRFYSVAGPFNIAALLLLSSLVLPAWSSVTRGAAMVMLFFCVLGWVVENRQITAGMSKGRDGFYRFADLAAVHRALQVEHLDGVFDGTGVLVYTAVDPRIIYPDDVRGIRTRDRARIAVVRYAEEPDNLLDELRKITPPTTVQRFDRFEVELFTLPAGLNLTQRSRPGFVPHIF